MWWPPPPLPAILVLLYRANPTQKGWKNETEPTPILLCHNLYLNRKNNYFMSVSQVGCIQLLTHTVSYPHRFTPHPSTISQEGRLIDLLVMTWWRVIKYKKIKKPSILTINNLSLENNTSAKSLQGINISA